MRGFLGRFAGMVLPAAGLVMALAASPADAQQAAPGVVSTGQCVALTFDDGPDPALTPRLLDILAQEGVKATFYVVGRRVAEHPGIVQRAFREGHEIGNHSWSHPVLTQLSNAQVQAEFAKTDAAIEAATGTKPATVRAPYGSQSNRIAQIAARPMVLWDTDTLDWLYRNSARVTRVADATGAGTIVLMHDVHPTTITAAPALIRGLKERGFRFVTVSDFLSGKCERATPMVMSLHRHRAAPVPAAKTTAAPAAARTENTPPAKTWYWPVYEPVSL